MLMVQFTKYSFDVMNTVDKQLKKLFVGFFFSNFKMNRMTKVI